MLDNSAVKCGDHRLPHPETRTSIFFVMSGKQNYFGSAGLTYCPDMLGILDYSDSTRQIFGHSSFFRLFCSLPLTSCHFFSKSLAKIKPALMPKPAPISKAINVSSPPSF